MVFINRTSNLIFKFEYIIFKNTFSFMNILKNFKTAKFLDFIRRNDDICNYIEFIKFNFIPRIIIPNIGFM